jgi:surface polysaccharide O-acyltransferase-like enzyme
MRNSARPFIGERSAAADPPPRTTGPAHRRFRQPRTVLRKISDAPRYHPRCFRRRAPPRPSPSDRRPSTPAKHPTIQAGDTPSAAAELAFTSYLRVAAIAGVVLIHAAAGLVTNASIRGTATWWIGTSLDLGSRWAVPVFIMVSGALLLGQRPNEGAREFYARRIRRIAIPLLVAHVGYFVVRAVLLHQVLTARVVVFDLLAARVYSQLYFFWIVLGLYLITPLLRTALAGRDAKALTIIGAAGIAFMWAVRAGATTMSAVGHPVDVWQPAALTLWIPYLGYFVLGYALRSATLGRTGLAASIVVFALANAVVVWSYTTGAGSVVAALLGGGYQGLPVAATAISLFLMARTVIHPASALALSPSRGVMRRLGELTLGVFVVHLAIMLYAQRLPGLSASIASRSVVATLILWAVVLTGSFVVCELLARIPVLRRTIGM